MLLRKKKDAPEAGSFEALEQTFKQRMSEIKKVSDTGAKLLEYQALRERLDEIYDPAKVKMLERGGKTHVEREYKANEGVGGGAFLGGLAGIGGATALLLALGIVAPVIAAPVVFGLAIAGLAGGAIAGPSLAESMFDEKNPAEVVEASKLHSMLEQLDHKMKPLMGTTSKNIKRLSNSPRLEEVKKTFPELESVFNARAKAAEQHGDFVRKNAASTPSPTL